MDPQEGALERAPARTPFVGREAEIEWLLERVRQAARGRPRACLVRGEPGIGKSRLLNELGRHALAERMHAWLVRGSPDVQTPYLAVESLIHDLAARCVCGPALVEASERWWKHLERDRTDEPGVLGIAPFAPPQRALSRAFQRAVLERARHGGFLILVDDFQWLDAPSLELIGDVVTAASEAAGEEPVALAVVMASSGGAPGSAAEGAERRLELELICDVLPVRGLGDRGTEDLLRVLGIVPPTRALAARLREASRGNPERLQRLVRELRRRGALQQREGTWVTTLDPLDVDEEKGSSLDLPLDAPLRGTLQRLALFASGAGADALARVTGLPPERIALHFREAEARGWLRRTPSGFAFEDPALARALAAEVPEPERPSLHHRIARWLTERDAGSPEVLAYHWRCAWSEAPAEQVLAAQREAAVRAMRAHDWRRAAFHYEHALQVAESSEVGLAARAELHYRAGLAHFRSLDGASSRGHFERAAADYEEVGDRNGALRALLERTRAIVSLGANAYGSRAPGLSDLEQRIEAIDAEDPSLRAYALAQLAEAHAMARDPRRAEAFARRAVQEAERASDEVSCLVHEVLGVVLMSKLDLVGAEAAFRESLRIGRRTGDAWLESLALNRLPIVLAWRGALDEARSFLLTAWEAADATGDWADYSLALGMLAGLALARGEFEEVESLARQAVSIARRSGYLWGAALAISAVAPARALRGRLDEARDAAALLETPGALAREVPPAWGAMAAVLRLRLSALVGRREAGAHEQAAGLVEALLSAEPDPQVLPALCCCVEIAALCGDDGLAERAAGRVAEAWRRGVVFTSALDDALPRVLGLAAEASGRYGEARSRFEAALEAAERGGARTLQARIHADLARVEQASGRTERAAYHAERAHALAERLGMEPLRAARSQTLQDDERRLLRGIAAGLDEPALAADLLLTRGGLVRLRERVFARIGASGNIEAAAYAHREGLVAPAQNRAGSALAEITRQAPPVDARQPRVLTLFVSDIANSSALIQRVGDEAAQRVIHEHNRAVRAGLRQHRGIELQHTGDGFIAAFESADGALRCALGLQQELEARRLGPEDAPLRVRIGLHRGEPLLEEGRLFGVSMHTAARICASCQAGEVRVSHEVWQQAEGGGPYRSADLGWVPLKGLFEPVRLHRVEWARDGSEAAV